MSTEAIIDRSTAIENLYNSIMFYPEAIYDIFKEFFGEERVDMQGFTKKEDLENIIPKNISVEDITKPSYKETLTRSNYKDIFILIHFPEVRITNENDRYVDVKHLWAKVLILPDGTLNGRFLLNRSEYLRTHYENDYMHSHSPGISHDFNSVCTGSGPINNTIAALNRSYDSDMWQMFCLELSKFIETESLNGVPFRKLENIGTSSMVVYSDNFKITPSITIDDRYKTIVNDFIEHLIKSKLLKFNFTYGRISLSMSYTEYIIIISNEFISWYNESFNSKKYNIHYNELIDEEIICKVKIDNFKIFTPKRNTLSRRISNSVLFTFKGEEIRVKIVDDTCIDENMCIILHPCIADYIIYKILQCINYKYGREENTVGPNTEIRYL
jgi:hypothetical protein